MPKKKYRVRAVAYDKRGRVIAEGRNSYTKTHPLQAHYAKKVGGKHAHRVFLHAEMDALIRSEEAPYTMEIRVYSEAGNISESKPCPICMEAMKEAGVKHLDYIKEDADGRKKVIECCSS